MPGLLLLAEFEYFLRQKNRLNFLSKHVSYDSTLNVNLSDVYA